MNSFVNGFYNPIHTQDTLCKQSIIMTIHISEMLYASLNSWQLFSYSPYYKSLFYALLIFCYANILAYKYYCDTIVVCKEELIVTPQSCS